MGEPDQVPVVEYPQFSLGSVVATDDACELEPFAGNLVVGPGGDEIPGYPEIAGQLTAEIYCGIDPGRDPGEIEHLVAAGGDRLVKQLSDKSGADHLGVALDPDDGTEFLENAVGEAVVRGHLDLSTIVRQPGQGLPEPPG